MEKIEVENSELDILFGRENYEHRNGKIYVYKGTDIFSKGYHKWLKQDNKIVRIGNKMCETGRISFFNKFSILRAKIENRIF